ncbi:MAG: winged helix-turn-helix domain-containing protein [Dehalococcoidia bacterium]
MRREGPLARRIAIIGSDSDALRPLAEVLEREGYTVALREPGEEATSSLAVDLPDVLLVEMAALPAMSKLKELLGREAQVPAAVAIVQPDQMESYDYTLGLADFVVWPTTPAEVVMRVKQALWRRANISSDSLLKFGDLLIDLANYKVYVAERPVELTFKEYELLRFLATHHGHVYSREALLNHVWGYDYYGGARTVDVHIRRLRSKVEDRSHTFIETVRNVGYRFRVPQ